ncbi:MAG: Lrp/AsnC family transcriptional regulator [Gammaproteobacteria bacterium]|nr:Lrp/AsnC family transcriptional regulator [Gammaproteobacteria bacterium]
MSHGLDDLSRRLVNRFQGGVPLVARPYGEMGAVLGTSEEDVIARLKRLLRQGIATRFGPSFDASRLGGALTLAALEVPEHRYDEIKELVNAYPEVAHNYRRLHRFNMWFVVATSTPAAMTTVVDDISRRSGLEVLHLPKLRQFRLGLHLVLGRDGRVTTGPFPNSPAAAEAPAACVPEAADWRLIDALQAGLPLEPEPWRAIAGATDMDEGSVLERLGALLAGGVIRRIGLLPNHYRLGLRANGMSVWDVADGEMAVRGEVVGRFDFVSHCYERPRRPPHWPYNLFAMVHGMDRAEVHAKTAAIARTLGVACRSQAVLFSDGILKKTGFRSA